MSAIAELIDRLRDNELVGLTRMAAGQPVRGSDVPVGIEEPAPVELAVLLVEIGRRVATGQIKVVGVDLDVDDALP
jgi:hypothetical protein